MNRHRLGTWLATIGGILLTLGLTGVPTFAASAGPAANGQYYGVAEWYPSKVSNGAYAYLYIQPSNAKDYASGAHVNQTVWEGTDNASDFA